MICPVSGSNKASPTKTIQLLGFISYVRWLINGPVVEMTAHLLRLTGRQQLVRIMATPINDITAGSLGPFGLPVSCGIFGVGLVVSSASKNSRAC